MSNDWKVGGTDLPNLYLGLCTVGRQHPVCSMMQARSQKHSTQHKIIYSICAVAICLLIFTKLATLLFQTALKRVSNSLREHALRSPI